jgi:hypothetical protein
MSDEMLVAAVNTITIAYHEALEEARLFLTEAGRTAARLPRGSAEVVAGIDSILSASALQRP